jgi:crossover junction endodeoxyribonuclease RusA
MERFEFVVQGFPRTADSKSRRSWQKDVTAAAASAWPPGVEPLQGELSARIIYFFTDSTNRDVDNIIKPILDALKGLVFVDDNIIFEVTARKTQKVAGLTIKDAPSCLVGALDVFSDFVFVRIEEGPNHAELPS